MESNPPLRKAFDELVWWIVAHLCARFWWPSVAEDGMTMCPRRNVLVRSVPWTIHPLDDAFFGRSVLWTMGPWPICPNPAAYRLCFITLQRQFRLSIPFLGIARPQPQFPHSCVYERFIYYIYYIYYILYIYKKGRPIVGIYNLLTDTWMWKLGLRPRYSVFGNICFIFSAFCLCSAQQLPAETWDSPVSIGRVPSVAAANFYMSVSSCLTKQGLCTSVLNKSGLYTDYACAHHPLSPFLKPLL